MINQISPQSAEGTPVDEFREERRSDAPTWDHPADGQGTITQEFGSFIADWTLRGAPQDARDHSVLALIDWAGATIAGWQTDVAGIVATAVSDEVGRGPAQLLLPHGPDAPGRLAALLNGCASHAIELDDIYAPGLYHPGSPTIASALAAAQMEGATGGTLLTAIAVGYQVSNAIAKAIQPSHYRLWHTTGTAGCFGAAAAAAAVFNLNADQSAHALATSATMAAGLQQAFRSDSMSKPLHAGRAAEAGFFSALCAAKGLTGEKHIFEGPSGFGRVMSENVDWAAAVSDLNGPWTVGQTTHKIHACCGHNFSAIDGALALRVDVDQTPIVGITIETYQAALEIAGIRKPITPFEGKFSLPFTVATALVYGRVGPEAFTAERMADPQILELASKTTLVASVTFNQAYPAMRGAKVTLSLADGRVLSHVQPTRRGSPTYPLAAQDIREKFSGLCDPILGTARSASLLDQMMGIGDAKSVRLFLDAAECAPDVEASSAVSTLAQ